MACRSPKLALRQGCVLDLSEKWASGRFLEVGAGIGLMTRLFLDRGYWGCCYDLDLNSRQYLRRNLGSYGDRIEVIENFAVDEDADPLFEYLFAFEVLEHIADDYQSLSSWSRRLRPGGILMVSVPAHKHKFGQSDERVGHIKRYERADLLDLLSGAGYRVERIVNYGFPLTELSRRLSNCLFERASADEAKGRVQRSLQSSYSQPKSAGKVLGLISESAYRPFLALQRVFYRYDWGDGLVAVAIKTDD
ncbi:methyltransferase domain-containing protein [Thiocapsa marina]|uniref:Methyltransferase type 12 n=1 Tax=Thiocapsa marina 5811 TaxID=768671 RepID=F9UEX2_9GAMM|nr:methyltransferase domain-containing protein [Thiocapsa marina]EGV17443.1 Methyltransferase type 12 [Thiocapsa marina 5811]